MTTWGANADQLDGVAAAMGRAASLLEGIRVQLTAEVHHAPWRGHLADQFRRDWDANHQYRLKAATGFLRDAETSLHANASQQRSASATVTGGSTSPTFTPPAHPPGVAQYAHGLWHQTWRFVSAPFRSNIGQDVIQDVTQHKLDVLKLGRLGGLFSGVGTTLALATLVRSTEDFVQHPGSDTFLELDDSIVRTLDIPISKANPAAGYAVTYTLDAIESKVGQQFVQGAVAGSISGLFDLKAGAEHLLGNQQGAGNDVRRADFWNNVADEVYSQ